MHLHYLSLISLIIWYIFQLIEIQQKLESKKKDIEKMQEKEKVLHATFTASLGENNKFAEFLTKVFKKKIKRSKKTTTGGDGRLKTDMKFSNNVEIQNPKFKPGHFNSCFQTISNKLRYIFIT